MVKIGPVRMEHHLNQVDFNNTQTDPMQMDHIQIHPLTKIDHVQTPQTYMDHVQRSPRKNNQIHTDLAGRGHAIIDKAQVNMLKVSGTQAGKNQGVMNESKMCPMNMNPRQMDLVNRSCVQTSESGDSGQRGLQRDLSKMDPVTVGKINPWTTEHENANHNKKGTVDIDHVQPDQVTDKTLLPEFKFDASHIQQGQGVKRKRVVWDIPTKLKILERLGNGERAVDLAREYGVGRSTISDMKSTESKLREFLSHSNNDSRSRCTMKLSADENLDRLLYTWFLEERSKGTYLSGPIIREKAKWFHLQLHPGETTFAASQGWLRRWKQRHGVTGSVFNLFMGASKSPGRRSRILDIPDKLKIIERLDNGEQVADLAKEYGVGKTTITAVMSAKAKLMVYQIQNDPNKPEKYMTKFACYESVDKALYTWYVEEKNKGTPLTGPIVKEKAKWFHDTMYPGNSFKASEGWLWRWKKRNGIKGPIGTNTGEDKQYDSDAGGQSSMMEKDEQVTDTAQKIQAIESSIAQIKSEETKLRKRIYKCRKGKDGLKRRAEKQGELGENKRKTPDGKRKRVVLDIPTKLKIIERVNNGERPVDLAREFGLGRSTITDIKLSEARLKMFMSTNDTGSCNRQTMRQPTYESVDKALYKWFVDESKKGTQLPGNVLRDKARLLHSQFYPDDSPFLASEGWLRRWKERHGLLPPTKSIKASQNPGERKKRVVLDVSTKIEIIERLHKGENPNVLAKEFGVSKTTLNDIKAAEDKLKEYMASCGKSGKQKFAIEQCHEVLNKAMYIWFLQERNKGSDLSWPELEARAIWFHTQLHPDCSVLVSSSKWLNQWKSSYGVFELCPQTETSPSVCQSFELFKKHLSEWMVDIDIGPEQLYCADESLLYWNSLPIRALFCSSQNDVLDYHRLQDKVTLLTCTNSSGSHKLPVLLLGKSNDPESLKLLDMTNLSVEYAFQKHASMSSVIFTNWFKTRFVPEVEKHLISQGLPLRAALLIKNCPAHIPPLEVETADGRIECVFLPMSLVSSLNPMNQGTVEFLKHNFRKSLVQKLISLKSHLIDVFRNLSLCDCILMIDSAWRSLTEQHILKSWEKSSLMQCFPNSGPVPELKQEFDIDTIGLSVLQEAFKASLSREEIQVWLNCDQELNTYEDMSDIEIVDYVKSLPVPEQSVEDTCAHEAVGSKTDSVYLKQEIDGECSGYSDSHDEYTRLHAKEGDTQECFDSDDSENSHVVKYISFSQTGESADQMPEGTSETMSTETAEFNENLVSIKQEPKDYDSDMTVSQELSDQENNYDDDLIEELNTKINSDMTEDPEIDQESEMTSKESRDFDGSNDLMSSSDGDEQFGEQE